MTRSRAQQPPERLPERACRASRARAPSSAIFAPCGPSQAAIRAEIASPANRSSPSSASAVGLERRDDPLGRLAPVVDRARPRRGRPPRRARSSATTTVSSSAAPRAIWNVSRSVSTCVVARKSLLFDRHARMLASGRFQGRPREGHHHPGAAAGGGLRRDRTTHRDRARRLARQRAAQERERDGLRAGLQRLPARPGADRADRRVRPRRRAGRRSTTRAPGAIATPEPRPERGGWGLYFVERLADSWGVADDDSRVWFRVGAVKAAA